MRQLLQVLQANAVDGELCMTVSHMARAAGLSETAVRRSLRQLIADGSVLQTGRRLGATAVFRLGEIPPELGGGGGAGAHADLPKEGGGGSPIDRPAQTTAARGGLGRRPQSPAQMLAERETAFAEAKLRDDLAEPLTDEEREANLRAAGEFLITLGGRAPLPPQHGTGVCLDCRNYPGVEHGEQPLYPYGLVLVCRDCYRLRAREKARAEAPRELVSSLLERLQGWRDEPRPWRGES